ncbi:hypothetical protein ACTMU2_27280 [Cupriavidus basilensis]
MRQHWRELVASVLLMTGLAAAVHPDRLLPAQLCHLPAQHPARRRGLGRFCRGGHDGDLRPHSPAG